MKLFLVILLSGLFFLNAFSNPKITFKQNSESPDIIRKQVLFNPNNISTWFVNSGIFNNDIRTSNTPGFMWPGGTNRFAVFTTGLTIGAKVLGSIRLAACSYCGEYAPGYINNGTPDSNANFKLYKVTRGDGPTNTDWANWDRMVPFGAPYYDVNNNGVFDAGIDTPGVHNAQQTIFICLTDGFQGTHYQSEGFSGGTLPLFAEMHLTAWAYFKQEYLDMQFIKFDVINKGSNVWDSTFMAIISDDDLGDSGDDFVGADTGRQMAYTFNSDNFDGWNGNPPAYGANPPAVGHIILKGARIKGIPPVNLLMTSMTIFEGTGWGGIQCVADPSLPQDAYCYLKGIKKDYSYFFHPFTHQRTKILWTGDPETNQGWTEYGYNGNTNMAWVNNCAGGDTMSSIYLPPGDRRFCIGTGAPNLVVSPGDTQKIITCQLIARGTSNLNSVTKLKQLADVAWALYNNNFVIGVQNISTEIPSSYSLSQNYPNPFNQSSIINFQTSMKGNVSLKIYDISGREIQTLVNENLNPGTYEVRFDGGKLGSGVYFYTLSAGNCKETKRMVILK